MEIFAVLNSNQKATLYKFKVMKRKLGMKTSMAITLIFSSFQSITDRERNLSVYYDDKINISVMTEIMLIT